MAVTDEELTVKRSITPVYTVSEIAHYIHVHPLTARSWVRRISGRETELEASSGVSFFDLISAFVIRQLRMMGLSLQRIRRAERYLTEWCGPYPFAHTVTWTDGAHVLFDPFDPTAQGLPDSHLLSADELGQQASVEILRQYLRRIEYSPRGIAVAWHPTDAVELNPRRQLGQPCVTGTRIPTRALSLMYKAGEPPEDLASLFDIPRRAVVGALRWEAEVRAKAA